MYNKNLLLIFITLIICLFFQVNNVTADYWYESYDFTARGVSAFWPMDENANDYSGNSLHGTAVNTSLTSGYFNQCYEFFDIWGQAGSSRIELPDYPHSSAVSYAAWINLDSYDSGSEGASFIFHRRAHYADQSFYVYSDGTLKFYNLRGTYTPNNEAYSTETVPLGEWHHVTVTMDNQYTRIYMDGELIAENVSAGDIYWDGSYYCSSIGLHRDGVVSWWHPFDGKIDEMTIFNYALSQEQVSDLASDTNTNNIADFWEESYPPDFSADVRAVPHDGTIYLEWGAADDTESSITYNVYISTTPGDQNFDVPDAVTDETSCLLEGLVNGTNYYIVVRAMDSFLYETENTNEIICTPGTNMLTDGGYNHDFEVGTGTRGPVLGKPAGWSASGQEYGEKITAFQIDDTEPYEGIYCALMETIGTPVNPDDLSIASLIMDNSVHLLKDHTYAVSMAVRRSQSQWARIILFSAGYSLIHTESFDARNDGSGDSGWERMYLHFQAPSDLDVFLQIDNIVTNERTEGGNSCKLWIDDVQIVDMGIETYTDVYNTTPPPPQCGIRNRYFDLGTETEIVTPGGNVYSSADLPKRWNIAFALDSGGNNAPGYPVWGQEEPAGLSNTTGEAGFTRARAEDTSGPAWPALSPDGTNINISTDHGQRHILSFDYGAAGDTLPLLRVFTINAEFSHHASLFVSPSVQIPGTRMWPLTLQHTPAFGESRIFVRFDNVTIGAGSGPHTDETTMYIDNVVIGVLED